MRAQRVQVAIEFERDLVEVVAQQRQPARALHHAVVEIAMHHPQAPAVGRDVDAVLHHLDTAEAVLQVAPGELVVVARRIDHVGALARLAQDLLHHVVVGLRPEPAPPQLPAVDDVAHQVQALALDHAQEVQQRLGLAAGRAQVHIGDEDGAHAQRPFGRVHG